MQKLRYDKTNNFPEMNPCQEGLERFYSGGFLFLICWTYIYNY